MGNTMRTAPHHWLEQNCRCRPDGIWFDSDGNFYRPATEDDAQYGHNDTWPGDPVPVAAPDARKANTLDEAARNPDGTYNGAKALAWLSDVLTGGKGVPEDEVSRIFEEAKANATAIKESK